ncbi:MAG: acyl carrier protein [Chthoniobacterales bacterium]
MATELTEEEKDSLRRSFKRCREGTVEAIIALRETGDTAQIPAIVRGIVWRYVQPEARPVVEEATPETPLAGLGIDSLMMLEVVLDVQDALDLVIEDSDLRQMQTIGDVVSFLQTRYAETHPQN